MGSRQNLTTALSSHACRIDHYLGKEMMQNMITMRFSNRFLSPMWNAQHISNVQVCGKSELHMRDMQGAVCSVLLSGRVQYTMAEKESVRSRLSPTWEAAKTFAF